jgi:hypothetical protein
VSGLQGAGGSKLVDAVVVNYGNYRRLGSVHYSANYRIGYILDARKSTASTRLKFFQRLKYEKVSVRHH